MLLRFKVRLAHLPLNHHLRGGPIANKSESAREGSCPGSVCQVPSLASLSGAELGFRLTYQAHRFWPCPHCPHREGSKGALWGIRGRGISVLKNLFSQEQVGSSLTLCFYRTQLAHCEGVGFSLISLITFGKKKKSGSQAKRQL